jgi:hypothetical protein
MSTPNASTTTTHTNVGADTEEIHRRVLARRLSQRHNLTDGYTNNLDIKPSAEIAAAGTTGKAGGIAVVEKEKKKEVKLAGWKHFLAGGIAGACEVIATMPLDVAKTQMQINPGKYSGPINALTRIASEVRNELIFFLLLRHSLSKLNLFDCFIQGCLGYAKFQ